MTVCLIASGLAVVGGSAVSMEGRAASTRFEKPFDSVAHARRSRRERTASCLPEGIAGVGRPL